MRQLPNTIVLCILVGCGGGDGPGGVTGTIGGMSIPIDDAISASITQTTQQGMQHSAFIVMGNSADLCGDAATNTSHPNAKGLIINVGDVSGSIVTTPTAPGTFTIFQQGGALPPKAAGLVVSISDATCHTIDASSPSASTGTVTLTAVSGNAFTGTFDVALDSGDHITGDFHPAACPALQTLFDNSQTQGPCV